MRISFFTALAYATLVVDGYLALAAVATKVVPQVRRYLPPFAWLDVSETTRYLVLLVATWTAFLALGCLRPTGSQRDRPHAAVVLWFGLVLAMVWLLLLLPLLVERLREFFVWGWW